MVGLVAQQLTPLPEFYYLGDIVGKYWSFCGQKGDILPLNNFSASEPLLPFRDSNDPGRRPGSDSPLNGSKGSDAEMLFNGKMSPFWPHTVQSLPNTSPS